MKETTLNVEPRRGARLLRFLCYFASTASRCGGCMWRMAAVATAERCVDYARQKVVHHLARRGAWPEPRLHSGPGCGQRASSTRWDGSLLIFDASILPRSMLPLYYSVQVKPNEYLIDGCSNIYTRGVDTVPIEITEP